MKAELTPEAVGLKIVASIPCPASTGLPNTTMCSVVEGPGIDPVSFQAKLIDPPSKLTLRAQQEMDEKMAAGEGFITLVTTSVVIVSAITAVIITLTMMCLWRTRFGASRTHGMSKETLPTIIDISANQGKRDQPVAA